jgi:hypothetical protein
MRASNKVEPVEQSLVRAVERVSASMSVAVMVMWRFARPPQRRGGYGSLWPSAEQAGRHHEGSELKQT